jgi:predicted DNA-binding WGR domain protein
MPDELRSPTKHHLVLHRIDPEQGVRRFYSLTTAGSLRDRALGPQLG